MVPQYCSYGSAGAPAVPATIFMSEPKLNHNPTQPNITKVGFDQTTIDEG